MSHQPKHIYEFGSYRLDAAERLLLREGAVVPLQPKVFDLLRVLVEQHGHLLEKDELMKLVWPDAIVEEANLANNISILRKTLSENGERFIETVPKRGYRFVAPVREQEASVATAPKPPVLDGKRRMKRWHTLAIALAILLLGGVAGVRSFWPVTRPPAAPGMAIKSIAVLPFKPLNRSKDDEYLGIGIADSVITRLSGAGKLVVRPVSAVSKYTASTQDPLLAGREQQVDAVLDASLWRSGERMRVTARLLNVRDGSSLWTYECEELCTDVFTVQTLISERVAEALMLQLTGAQKARLTRHYTENRAANRLYLLGRFYWNKRTEEALEKGVAYFQQAIDKDPNYALAYAGLAECYVVRANLNEDPREFYPQAKAYAAKALALDGTLAEAHTTLAGVSSAYDWDQPGAERGYKRALALNDGYATAHQRYSFFLMKMGRTEESLSEIRRAEELDPASPTINGSLGSRLYYARRYDQAVEQLRKALEMEPNRFLPRRDLGTTYVQMGMYAEAIAELNGAVELSRDGALAALGHAYAAAGQSGQARRVLAELLELSRRRYVPPVDVAAIYAGLGEKDSAFAWLEKGYRERAYGLIFLKVEPKFDPLRSDPRFADLLRRVGLAP